MSVRDRLRARSKTLSNQPQVTEASRALSVVPTNSQPNPQAESTDLQTILRTDLTDESTLAERTVRFYSMIFQGIPIVGNNPMIGLLVRRMEPYLMQELRKASHEQLEKMYQAMLCSLGQVYAPHARALVIDLKQSHLFIEEVEATVGPLALEEADVPALPEASLDDEPLAPPAPAPPDATPTEDDPLVGVELPDGSVVAMTQSQLKALRGV